MKGIKNILECNILSFALAGSLWWSYIFFVVTTNRYHTFFITKSNPLISIPEFMICVIVSGYLIYKIIKKVRISE